jgi:DNA-directed RNA polymerase subunit RPC12/RpoP
MRNERFIFFQRIRNNIRMVVFHCGSCGESLKKNQVDKHIASSCRGVQTISCIDCGKDFTYDMTLFFLI